MARTKVAPISTQISPPPSNTEKGVGSCDSLETSSSSLTSNSSTPTCPHCRSSFPELSEKDFRHHVAVCSRPSTAESAETTTTSGSSLSPPPTSPGIAMTPSKKLSIGGGAKVDLDFDYSAAQELAIANPEDQDSIPNEHRFILPYIDPTAEFDYYDQAEGHEDVNVDPNDPDLGLKFKYPKVPPISHFEKYLKNPGDMSYEILYKRAEFISTNILLAWEKECEAIDKEIFAHEMQEKERLQVEKEAEKAMEEAEKLADQLERKELTKTARIYATELKSNSRDWEEWLEQFDEDDEHYQRLVKLRDPQFRARLQKQEVMREQEIQKLRQKELKELSKPKLLNEPLPEYKPTKEELDAEKKKTGRLMDPIKWDDMKEADVYGFEYSAHVKHIGNQQYPTTSRKRGIGEAELGEGRSGRAQRMVTRKMYDQSTPEDESDELSSKRQRKIRVLDDGVDQSKASRKQSRSQTPMRRTFPSGKPIGRPPKTQSKLKDVQLASGVEEAAEDDAAKDEDTSQHLLPAEEEQLQQSAQSLVNQVAEELPAEPVVKKKHAGGRPRKHPLPAPIVPVSAENNAAPALESPVIDVIPPKPKGTPGKSRKKPNGNPPKPRNRSAKKDATVEPSAETEEENGILPTTEQDEDSQATEAIESRRGSVSSQASISSFGAQQLPRSSTRERTATREARVATRGRAAATVDEDTVTVQESPRKSRVKRVRGSSEIVPPAPIVPPLKNRKGRGKEATVKEEDVTPAVEPVIKEEATLTVEAATSPSSSRNKRQWRASVAVVESPIPVPTPVKSERKARLIKASSTPALESVVKASASPKPKAGRKVKGPLAKLLPPREPSTRARRPPRLSLLDGVEEDDDDEDHDKPETEYERFQALTSPGGSVTLGKRIRKSRVDLQALVGDGDDEDGDDEYEG
ncbi:hypothetical protein CJF32_00006591 [Rutstroemia sp. NJR-2017a WRK4]|nr:hypothetical protein CJF32_00006591 [Rutstroemia sp. NJR-2017a WRK4]